MVFFQKRCAQCAYPKQRMRKCKLISTLLKFAMMLQNDFPCKVGCYHSKSKKILALLESLSIFGISLIYHGLIIPVVKCGI